MIVMEKGKSKSKLRKINSVKAHTFEAYLKKQLKNPIFRKAYKEEGKKVELGYQIFLARKRAGLTQAELADRIGTRQSNISRLEFGDYNFTVAMLEKIAKALDLQIKIDLISNRLDQAA